jgi:hypothetical protein
MQTSLTLLLFRCNAGSSCCFLDCFRSFKSVGELRKSIGCHQLRNSNVKATMGPQIGRLLALFRPGGISNSAAQTSKAIHALASQAPIGLAEIAAAPAAQSVPSKILHPQNAPKFLERGQVKRLVKQLLQPIANSQAAAPLPIVARQVSNPTAVQSARYFSTIVRSAVSESNTSSLRRCNLPNAYGKAGAFARNGLGRRFQYTDGRGVTHFRPKGFRGAAQDPNRVRRYLVIAVTAGVSILPFFFLFRLTVSKSCLC